MTDNTYKDELNLFRDNLRRFIESEISPHYLDWERDGIFPREVWNKLGEQGFLCVDIPEQYGGYGVDARFSFTIAEEFARANCNSIATSIVIHSDIVAHYLVNHGTEAQKQQYLPKMLTGECVGALAMTEPDAGSDVQSIHTRAVSDGDDYVVNGSKIFITNGQHADLIVLACKTNDSVAGAKGTSLLMVDASLDGFSRGRNLDKIGLHACDTSELFFNDMRVKQSALLGELDRGFVVLMSELQRERLALAYAGVGAAEGCIAETIAYVKQRKAFGKAIAEFQNTRFQLAELATDVRVHRAFVDECMDQFIAGSLDVTTVSMAKLAVSEMQGRVTDGCLQLFGGYGYMTEYGISRQFTDARVQRIYGGTSEIMKELISRDIMQ